MTKTKSSRRKRRQYVRIRVRIVTVPITLNKRIHRKRNRQKTTFSRPHFENLTIHTCFLVVRSYLSIVSLPKSMGKNSLNVMCCISATTILLASYNYNVFIHYRTRRMIRVYYRLLGTAFRRSSADLFATIPLPLGCVL